LEGNYDEAAELAVPGSLATSRELMDGIKDLVSGKSISVLAIQNSGQRTTVLMQEAQSADNKTDDRARTQFTVILEAKDGRLLVTNVAVHAARPRARPARNSPLNQSGRTPTSAAAPKETKVFSLKHARAAELQQTLSQLLELDNPDLRVAVDARTNRLLVHGTPDRMEVVQALIIQLDEPSTASATDQRPGEGGNNSPPPQQPVEAKP
jgi:type II secretory pathway component GspD/PulD (secretin)